MRIKGLCCLVLCVAFYTAIMVVYFQSKQGKKRFTSLPPKLIVLVSQPRSGSTFLGNLLSKSMESVYFYEPLYRLDTIFKIDINFANTSQRVKYDSLTSEYLQKVFSCDFSDREHWHKIFDSPFKVLGSNKCSEGGNAPARKQNDKSYTLNRCLPFLNANQVQKECQKSNLVVKLLEMRIPFSKVLNLQNFVETYARHKILYLVRDPRAAFLSLLKTGWVAEKATNPEFQKYVSAQCKTMSENLKAVNGYKNFEIIRYEDIIVKPPTALKSLFTFLGERTSDKLRDSLNKQPCYVPKFNNPRNLSLYQKRKLLYKLLPVPDKQDENNEDDEDERDKWEDGTINDDEIDFHKITERHRKNYRCYAINKWRYAAERDFIELVERHCGAMMKMLGYKKTNGDMEVMKDINERLVDSDIQIT